MLVINYPSGTLPSPSLLPLTLLSPPLYWHFFQVPLRVCLYPPMFLSGERHYHSSHLIPSPPSPPPPSFHHSRILLAFSDNSHVPPEFTCTSWVERDSVRSNFIYLTQAQALPPPPCHFSRILLAFLDSSQVPIYTPEWRNAAWEALSFI